MLEQGRGAAGQEAARLTGLATSMPRAHVVLLAGTLASCAAAPAWAASGAAGPAPDGAALVRLLGSHATRTFSSPQSPAIGALVRLPAGTSASDMGLREASPGIARL